MNRDWTMCFDNAREARAEAAKLANAAADQYRAMAAKFERIANAHLSAMADA